jgi:hypothetical protein
VTDVRTQIVSTYAEWTALSALRSGSLVKSRQSVYRAIRGLDFSSLFDSGLGPFHQPEFDSWHRDTVEKLQEREPRLNVGWAAKIVNVYLKTRVYVGGQGRLNLAELIHPPIDAGLWKGLKRRFQDHPEILVQTHRVNRIKSIDTYECYRSIVDGCRAAAKLLSCKLIEVEQLWAGTEIEQAIKGPGATP